jgi:hypothetical protein
LAPAPIVLEKASFGKANELLADMPTLQHWIHTEFEKRADFGLYEVWRLRQAPNGHT